MDVMTQHRRMLNVILAISAPASEGPDERRAWKRLNEFYAEQKQPQPPLHTVAETIFPAWEYRHRGLSGVLDTYEQEYQLLKAGRPQGWGVYAHRLVRRMRQVVEGGPLVEVRPLEVLIKKMQDERMKMRKGSGGFRSCYELGVAEGEYDLPLYDAASDGGLRRGGPCLSHLSFKLWEEAVYLTAVYRSHDYRNKVPGNLLGLARLQACVAHEVGATIGALVVHSTYAYVDGPIGPLVRLLSELREVQVGECS